MIIRKAASPDAAIIAQFNIDLALETEQLRLDPGCVSAGVQAVLNDSSKGSYFVAEMDDHVVGQVMITFEWSDWRNANIWWLQSVFVDPAYRGRGVFAALFRQVEILARESSGVCGLRLYMHEANTRARSAYYRLGMSETKYRVLELDFRTQSDSVIH
jgi:GNAT superfamily N-acetyltransferase